MIENAIDRTEQLLCFYRNQYPEIKFQICYNYMGLYLNLLLKCKEDTWYGSMPIDDITPERVNLVILDYLARIKIPKNNSDHDFLTYRKEEDPA